MSNTEKSAAATVTPLAAYDEKVSLKTKGLSALFREHGKRAGSNFAFPKDFYQTHLLPEGVDYETILKIQDHHLDIADALLDATGEEGIVGFQDDEKLETLSAVLEIGRDRVSADCRRSRQFQNPSDNSRFTRHAYTSAKYDTGANAKRDQYKAIQENLYTKAKSIFQK